MKTFSVAMSVVQETFGRLLPCLAVDLEHFRAQIDDLQQPFWACTSRKRASMIALHKT